jgi:hypothetical protein
MSDYYDSEDCDSEDYESSTSEIIEEKLPSPPPLKLKSPKPKLVDVDTTILEKTLFGILGVLGGLFYYFKKM